MSYFSNKTSFAVIVSFLCVALVGAIMLPMLTVRLHPLRYNPTITVDFSMYGSSARVVEMGVTSKLEGLLARMKGVRGINSKSYNGGGSIWVYLDKHANIDALRLEASSIVRQAWPDLPDGTSYPQVTLNTPSEGKLSPFLTYTINAPETPASIQRYAEEYIQPVLSRVKGVYKVSVSGASPMEWRLTYNPQQLETLGISYGDIQSAISSYYGTEFIGKVHVEESGWHQLAITPEKNIGDKLPLERMFVKNKDGRLLRVSELVSVLHVESAPQSFYRINGLNSIYLSITADENANQITLGEEIKSMMKELEAAMPKGYETHIGYDATEYIDKELDKIYFRCGLTVLILLLFVLLMTRQWKYTFLVVTSLAVNLLIAVVIYYFAGIDIQLYTLAGITISLNLIIDNIIVMTDHILQRKNMKAYLAILAATLTTICALGVVLFLDEGLRAKLLDFAIVVIINLAVSLAVALFFVPAMMDRLGLKKRKARGKHAKRMIVHFTNIYGKMIGFTCRHKVWACVILVLVFGLPVFLIPEKMEDDKGWHKWYNETLGSDYYKEKIKPIVNTALGGTWRLFVEKVYNGSYFDEKHETVLHVNATLPNGSTLEQMNNLIARMEEILKGYSEIKQFHTQVHSAYRASIDIYFPEEHQYSSFPYRLKSEITSRALELGGGSWSVYGLMDQGFNNKYSELAGSYKIKLTGYNYEQLHEYADILKNTLMRNPRIDKVNILSEFKVYKDDYSEFIFEPNINSLMDLNLVTVDIYNSVFRTLGYNVNCNIYYHNDRINLYSSQRDLYDIWNLSHKPFKTESKSFKLYSLGEMRQKPIPSDIIRIDQEYILCIQYEYLGTEMGGKKHLEHEIINFKKILPPGYNVYSGTHTNKWSSNDNSQYLLLLLIATVIFIVTSILFNSLRKPFAILFVIPISFIGVFLTFWLFKLNFDQGGFAAMILLCGITVNAAIYLLDEYGNIRERYPQMASIRAYLKAWNVKIAPIMLTVISTILGFIPFIVGGTKEAFWFPLAAGTIGGLLMSLAGLFIFLPIYALGNK